MSTLTGLTRRILKKNQLDETLGGRMLLITNNHTEIQRAQKSENILQKKAIGNIALSDLHIHYQTIVIKERMLI